jgi:nitrogen fixation/metabolism regulation signal transduction histidine kinase
MALNSFYLNILLRIIFMSATNLGFFYFLIHRERFFTLLFLGLLFIIQVIWLIHYINSVNRSLARFLLTLGEEETMLIPIQDKIEKTFQGLQHSFKRLNAEIGRLRLEKQYSAILIRNIVEHLGSGVLAWNDTGQIELINQTGLKLFNLTRLNDINELDRKYPGIVKELEQNSLNGKITIQLLMDGIKTPFLFRTTEFLLGEKHIHLVSFQSILNELEENEMISWEKLMRVFTHEVANSVTPITTLGANIRKRLATVITESKDVYSVKNTLITDLNRCAEIIEQRGNRLIDFINQYKNMLRLPEPELQPVQLSDLIRDVCSLCESLESRTKYRIEYHVLPSDLTCSGDRKMLEQVLINLIRNAVEAMDIDREGIIEVRAEKENQNLVSIRIKDNGQGIPRDIIDQVFIPFFTTREKGSGIGLSLCRRIIHQHGGSIFLQSEEKTGTTVYIKLPFLRE